MHEYMHNFTGNLKHVTQNNEIFQIYKKSNTIKCWQGCERDLWNPAHGVEDIHILYSTVIPLLGI